MNTEMLYRDIDITQHTDFDIHTDYTDYQIDEMISDMMNDIDIHPDEDEIEHEPYRYSYLNWTDILSIHITETFYNTKHYNLIDPDYYTNIREIQQEQRDDT